MRMENPLEERIMREKFQAGMIIPPLLILAWTVGAGCKEQEQKSRDTGKAVIDTVKTAEKNIDDAVARMQERMDQLEEENK
ncbi:hypothetical protein UZ36_07420 [Candidatus Nitromaritima sp. SCGC AAA799-C22]|nr:hypothetical protein UZ36_07420 [Candidatus Nitromaritima sp. SCGC AAA799-C22]